MVPPLSATIMTKPIPDFFFKKKSVKNELRKLERNAEKMFYLDRFILFSIGYRQNRVKVEKIYNSGFFAGMCSEGSQ